MAVGSRKRGRSHNNQGTLTDRPTELEAPPAQLFEDLSPNDNNTRSSSSSQGPSNGRRGPTKDDWEIPQEGKRFEIKWNSQGCATGKWSGELGKRIASLAKHGHLWPIDKKWTEQDQLSFTDTWSIIVDHFDLRRHKNAGRWVKERIHSRWLSWRNQLHKNNYLPYNTDQERLAHMDKRVDPNQFKNMLITLASEDFKCKSEQNSKNQKLKKMNHHYGPITFVRVGDKMPREEGAKSPSRMEVLKWAYKRKEGQKDAAVVQSLLDKMQEYVDVRQLEASLDDGPIDFDELETEAITKILGKERTDRVRGAGVGAIKKNSKRPSRARMPGFPNDCTGCVVLKNQMNEERRVVMDFMKKVGEKLQMDMTEIPSFDFEVGPSDLMPLHQES